MSAISLKSITGITSITTPAGVDNQLTLHNNNTTEAVKLDIAGNLHFHNHLNITGVSTASNFKTGTSNLHNTGLNVQDLDVDGHTNLDNVSIAGVSTFAGATDFGAGIDVIGTITDTGTDAKLNLTNSGTNATEQIATLYTSNSGTHNRIVIKTYTNGGGDPYIKFDAGGQDMIVGTRYAGTTNNLLVLGPGLDPDDASSGIFVKGSGNIGMGTDNPATKTAIVGSDSGDVYLQIANSTTGSDANSGFLVGLKSDEGATLYQMENNYMRFGTNGAERLRITSDGKVKLPDAGEIQFGGTLSSGNGDLRIYHDSTNSLNLITAATNFPIKISGGVQFFDYTGVTKRATIDSDGFRIGTVSAPTLPTTGVTPMIMRTATNFTKEVHRTISDYRGVGDGTHYGYLLLVPAWPGSNQPGKKFYGTIMCDRGSTGSGNSTQVARVHASTAYNNDKLIVEVDTLEQYIIAASKVTYSGVTYLALKFGNGGGGPNHGIHIDGIHRGTDSNFLKLLRGNEVTVVDDYYGSYNSSPAFMPACGVFVTGQPGSSYDGGVLTGGTVRYQYAPAGQSSPYNSSNGEFTARVSGIYLVTGSVLVQTGTGRLEAILEYYNGSSWSNYVAFNGTGTTYDGPTFTCMIPLKEGYKLRIARQSGNAYNSGHPQTYFGVHLLNGLRRQDVSL